MFVTVPASLRASRFWLVLAGGIALAVRLAVIWRLPDADTDAYGHFAIGRALVADPTNLVVHWVWLPGYHYLLWALIHLGVGFSGVRVGNALLQAFASAELLRAALVEAERAGYLQHEFGDATLVLAS